MKTCTTCNTECYDEELFCIKCGTSFKDNCVCPYCGNLVEPYALNCLNCGASLNFTLCPEPLRSRVCDNCHVAIRKGKYCSNCGTKYKLVTKATLKSHMPTIVIFSILAVFAILTIITAIMSIIPEPDYVSEWKQKEDSYYELSKTAAYKVITVDELFENLDDYSEDQYIQITGTIADDFYKLVCLDLNLDTRDFEVRLNYYDYDVYQELVNKYTIGDIITLKCRISIIHVSSDIVSVKYYEIVDD